MTAGLLDLNDHVFGKPREILCVSLALALHVPLLFWKGRPDAGPLGDPIVGVDFVVEEEKPEVEPPPKKEEPKEATFFERVQKMVGLASRPAPVDKLLAEPAKPELSGASAAGPIQVSRKVQSILGEEKLSDKARGGLSGTISVDNIKTEAGLAAGGIGAGPIVGGGGTIKSKSTAFRVGSKDLPFAVKNAPDGDLSNGQDADAPRIAVSKRSDRGIKSVSTAFFGTGGGTGGGDGPGDGSGGGGGALKDKGSGLSGVSGGFAGIGDVGGSSSGGSSISGVGVGGTGRGVGGGGGRSPYEITGPLSNRRILETVLPPYPDWAREQGLIASVSLKFFVLHTGGVKGNITVQRSSGYAKLDNAAIQALRLWRFEPLSDAQYGQEQWGIITFKFRAL